MDHGKQKELNNSLLQFVKNGNAEMVRHMLENGADPNFNADNGERGVPLIWAAHKGNFEIAKILLDAGADTPIAAADYAGKNGHPEMEKFLLIYQPPAVKTTDEIVFQRPLGNRTLEEIFNFTTLERISLVRIGKAGPVEAIACTGFSAIEDKSDESLLRKAFDEHIRRGGKTAEGLVFPNVLPKSRLTREGARIIGGGH